MQFSELSFDFLSNLGVADFDSWINVQKAYRDYAWKENIFDIGYFPHTGYVYITLDNDIIISCSYGQGVEYFTTIEAIQGLNDEEPFETLTDALRVIY